VPTVAGLSLRPPGCMELRSAERRGGVMNDFVDELRIEAGLSDTEVDLLRRSNIASAEALYSLTLAFPTELQKANVDVAKLSYVSGRRSSAAFSTRAVSAARTPRKRAFGARPPTSHPVRQGYVVPPSPFGGTAPSATGSGGSSSGETDYRIPSWPVRDQGDRGTCVAHALVALREWVATSSGLVPRLSEQYLFWASKQPHLGNDPLPHDDGTLLSYASRALEVGGVCEAHHWPYEGRLVTGNVTHQDHPQPPAPATAAKAAALHYKVAAGPGSSFTNGLNGNAPLLLGLLRKGRPVAITVPVFESATNGMTNWSTPFAEQTGTIAEPLDYTVFSGGHAVCVTGFVSKTSEPCGGYFVFRNSWGDDWAFNPDYLPNANQFSRERGYGAISASYIDRYLWEACTI